MIDGFKLLKGGRVVCDSIIYKSYTIGELIDKGFEEYQRLVAVSVLEIGDLVNEEALPKEALETISLFDIFTAMPDTQNWFLEFIHFFIEGEWSYNQAFNIFVTYSFENPIKIKRENFINVLENIRQIYCVEKPKSDFDEESATDDEVAKMLREFAEVKKKQNKSESGMTYESILEGITVKHPSYNLFNIWDLTMYQLMHTFYRLEHVSTYSSIMQSIYAGVMSSKDVKMKEIHWANKMTV